MIDLVLKEFGKVAQFSGLNLVPLPFQILVLHGDFSIALDLHEN